MERNTIDYRYCYDDMEIREELPKTNEVPVTICVILKPKKRRRTTRKGIHGFCRIVSDHMYEMYKMEHDNNDDNQAKFYFEVILPFAWWLYTTFRNKNTSWAQFESHGVSVLVSKIKNVLKIIICRKGELHVFGEFYSKE